MKQRQPNSVDRFSGLDMVFTEFTLINRQTPVENSGVLPDTVLCDAKLCRRDTLTQRRQRGPYRESFLVLQGIVCSFQARF